MFTDEELRCFSMLGRHLFALLRNCKLVVELHESLATVRLTQPELAAKVSELVVTREQLVQNEKLAMAGELAGSVAHEVNNPLSVVIGSLDLMLEYKGIVDNLWRAADGAVTYLRNQSDPEAHAHANRLCAGENSQQELAGTIGNVVGTIDSMLAGARRLADLVNGFWRFAERRSSAPVVIDLGRAARELAEEYGASPTVGPPLVAMVAGDDLRVAVRGVMAFLSEPERRRSRAVAATKIHTDVRAGRPCVVVSDPDVIVSAVDCRGIFDPASAWTPEADARCGLISTSRWPIRTCWSEAPRSRSMLATTAWPCGSRSRPRQRFLRLSPRSSTTTRGAPWPCRVRSHS